MRENTPPRPNEFDEDELEEIVLDNDFAPDDDDEELFEMEEVTLEELEARLNDEEEHRAPVEDKSQVTFAKHAEPVFACALHPAQKLAATGGQDDKVCLWNVESGELIYEITAHSDTVTEVHFNSDGSYLATADMAGNIIVFKMMPEDQMPRVEKVWEYAMGDMSWLFWHFGANVLVAGSETGEVYVWRIPSGECKILPGEGKRCEAGALTGDGKKLFAAYANAGLKLWDLKNCTAVMQVDETHPLAHTSAITAVACEKASPLYMSGSVDGKILFSTNNGPVAAGEAGGSVEAVAFSPSADLKLAASGTLQGEIAIWDTVKFTVRTLCEHPEAEDGVTNLKWLNKDTLLVATMNGNIYGYDARSGIRKFNLSGHREEVYDMCFDRERSILLSASEDTTAKIFQLPEFDE